MELVYYQRDHLDSFVPGPWDIATTMSLEIEDGWEGKAVSIREDGRTLGVVGVAVPGATALVWAVLSDELRRRPIALCRMAKASLSGIKDLPGVDKVAIEVDLEFTTARRWAEWLGFAGASQNNRWPGQNREMTWQPKHS